MHFLYRWMVGAALASLLSHRGFKKRSLSRSGALAAFVVGSITFACGLAFGCTLIAFYWSGSKLTKYRATFKQTIDANYKAMGGRNYNQVLSCSVIGVCVAIFYTIAKSTSWKSTLLGAYVSHYACCAGDTWASELGVLSAAEPFLITTWKRVPKGTNGAISLFGTLASLLGGAFVGTIFAICRAYEEESSTFEHHGLYWVALSAMVGLLGSIVDSFLGATMQETRYDSKRKKISGLYEQHEACTLISGHNILTNEQVNLVSAFMTTIIGAGVAQRVFAQEKFSQ